MNLRRTPLLIEGFGTGTPTPRERRTKSDRQSAPASGTPYSPDSHYLALELSHGSKKALAQHFPSKYKSRTADHVTLNYDPSQEDLDRFHNTPEHKKTVNLHATHHADDEKMGIHAVRVSGVEHLTKKEHPHITISHAPGAKPVQSNDLLAQQRGDRVAVPRKVGGKIKHGHLPLTGTIRALPKRGY